MDVSRITEVRLTLGTSHLRRRQTAEIISQGTQNNVNLSQNFSDSVRRMIYLVIALKL